LSVSWGVGRGRELWVWGGVGRGVGGGRESGGKCDVGRWGHACSREASLDSGKSFLNAITDQETGNRREDS